MDEKRFIGGSRAFFEGIEDFRPGDSDWMEISSAVPASLHLIIISEGWKVTCFQWSAELDKADLLAFVADERHDANIIAACLLPEFAEHYGIGIDDLRGLLPLAERLRSRHAYLGIILRAYIANGNFELTDDQRAEAFEIYKEGRNGKN